jgi:hypothetical protein
MEYGPWKWPVATCNQRGPSCNLKRWYPTTTLHSATTQIIINSIHILMHLTASFCLLDFGFCYISVMRVRIALSVRWVAVGLMTGVQFLGRAQAFLASMPIMVPPIPQMLKSTFPRTNGKRVELYATCTLSWQGVWLSADFTLYYPCDAPFKTSKFQHL